MHERLQEIRAAGPSQAIEARDPVNLPMIRNWAEALQNTNPIYVDRDAAIASGHPGPVSPPAMIAAWTMKGLQGQRPADDPLGAAVTVMRDLGFHAVVGTNCRQSYSRYVEHGEHLRVVRELAEVSGLKATALGQGYFLTARETWFSDRDDEPVAQMDLRQLRYDPITAPERPAGDRGTPREPVSAATGIPLPRLSVVTTPTFIIAAALATRDFEDIHHDHAIARERGHPDIFANIFTGIGLVERIVTEGVGTGCRLRAIDVRLGVPCYANDTLTLTGDISFEDDAAEIATIVGRNSIGDHLKAVVHFDRS